MKFFICLSMLCCVLIAPMVLHAEIPAGTDYSQINKTTNPESAYRVRTFRAYLPQDAVRNTLRTNNYSAFENPTGIYYTAGEQITVEVQGIPPRILPLLFIILTVKGAC